MAEGAQLPIAKMGGSDQDAPSALFGCMIIFESLVTDPVTDVGCVQVGEAGECEQQTRNGIEHAVDQAFASFVGKFREGEAEIHARRAPQFWQGAVEQRGG